MVAEPATDAELLVRADTDAHAFRIVYDRHADAIFAYFSRRGVGHHTALDLTAETFAEAWRCRARFQDLADGSARPWLFGIARHELSHAARHRAVATAARARLAMISEPAPLDRETERLLDRLDGMDPDLLAGLEALPPDSRRAVEARIVDGRSYDAIADELQCTPLAARIRVSRAITALRNRTGIGHGFDRQGETA